MSLRMAAINPAALSDWNGRDPVAALYNSTPSEKISVR